MERRAGEGLGRLSTYCVHTPPLCHTHAPLGPNMTIVSIWQELGLPVAPPLSKAVFSHWRESVKIARIALLQTYLTALVDAAASQPAASNAVQLVSAFLNVGVARGARLS